MITELNDDLEVTIRLAIVQIRTHNLIDVFHSGILVDGSTTRSALIMVSFLHPPLRNVLL